MARSELKTSLKWNHYRKQTVQEWVEKYGNVHVIELETDEKTRKREELELVLLVETGVGNGRG